MYHLKPRFLAREARKLARAKSGAHDWCKWAGWKRIDEMVRVHGVRSTRWGYPAETRWIMTTDLDCCLGSAQEKARARKVREMTLDEWISAGGPFGGVR